MTYLVDGAASRRRAAHRTDLNELERGFVLSIEAKQTVDVGIHEAGEETRRQTEAVSGGREVRQHRAGVPVEMAPATTLILPGVSPEERAEHDGRGAPAECERSTLRTGSGIERAESVDLCEIDVARK